jgi:ribose-phosphate pyrophosphokinase
MKKLSFIFFSLLIARAEACMDDIILFSGNANPKLAQDVAEHLNICLGKANVGSFNDGEIQIQIQESVRGKNVYILQPTCTSFDQSVNDHVMELYLLTRTMKRASSSNITAIIPYFGYARQDRKTESRVPISAADIALMLEEGGVDRVVTIDLHSGQMQGFFRNCPVDNLFASSLFVSYFSKKDLQNVVIVSPDAGGVERAKKFAEGFKCQNINADIALISKERAKAGVVATMNLIGDVEGCDCIIVDDMCDTAGTLVKAANLLKNKGANRVFAIASHAVFSKDALRKISDSILEEMVVTDTIPLKKGPSEKIKVISVAKLIAEAIKRIENDQSISELFYR